jgi:fatty aldehyde-generating acyl-ACP reductase
LQADGVQVEIATDLERFSVAAEVAICAASLASPSLLLNHIAPNAIICDAGYPKNLSPNASMPDAKIFFGGLGQIARGLKFVPDFDGILNRHPFPNVVHGCLLEGMALALEERFEPFSQGRGFITPRRVDEVEKIAARQGIHLAPFYNADTVPQIRERTLSSRPKRSGVEGPSVFRADHFDQGVNMPPIFGTPH